MNYNFPNKPSTSVLNVGDTYTLENGVVFEWDGVKFVAKSGADKSLRDDLGAVDSDVLVGGVPVNVFARLTVTPERFGATGYPTDDTAAFEAAKEYLYANGGGSIILTKKYAVKDWIIDRPRIMLEGISSAFSYDLNDNVSQLTNTADATFVLYFSYTSGATTFGASQGSGFKNLQIKGDSEFGVIVGAGSTIHEDSCVQGFDYGLSICDAANANAFKNVSFLGSEFCNFAVTEEEAMAFIYPFLPATAISNTAFTMINCVSRVGKGFGAILRDGANWDVSGLKCESNKMGGMYILRMDNSTVRNWDFHNLWLENNYEDYTAGSTSYSIAGNKMLWTALNTSITWSSASNAGFQLTIDSQTRAGGAGCDNVTFNEPTIAGAGTAQKGVQILSGTNVTLKKPWLSGGNQASFFDIQTAAWGFAIIDPIQANDPTALVPSISSGNIGTRGLYMRTGNSSAANQLGGLYPEIGVFGGPFHFPSGTNSKPYHDDPRVLDDYRELNSGGFNLTWRTGGATPFTVTGETNSLTKIGRLVALEARATLTANSTTGAASDLWIIDLPYPVAQAGNVSGTVWIANGGGGAAAVVKHTLMYAANSNSLVSIENVFPSLAVGQIYNVSVKVSYFAAT